MSPAIQATRASIANTSTEPSTARRKAHRGRTWCGVRVAVHKAPRILSGPQDMPRSGPRPSMSSRRAIRLAVTDKKFDSLLTRAVHGGEPRVHPYDAITPPIAQTATYTFANTAELVRYMSGEFEREEYGRYGNPSVRGM